MKFVGAIWKLLVGIKDALVLLLLIIFFSGLYGALSARPAPVRDGVLDLDLNGSARTLFDQIAQRFGLETVYDGDYPTGGQQIRFRVPAADYREAHAAVKAQGIPHAFQDRKIPCWDERIVGRTRTELRMGRLV